MNGILDDIQFVIGKLKAVILESRQNASSTPRPTTTTTSNDDDDSDDETTSELDDTVQDQMRKSRESIIITFAQIQKILGRFRDGRFSGIDRFYKSDRCALLFGVMVGNLDLG